MQRNLSTNIATMHWPLSSSLLKNKMATSKPVRAQMENPRKKKEHIAKEETVSPTVATEATFALAAIAAHERRIVSTMDLPGAFLHANNDSFVIMKLTGKLAELTVKTVPNIYCKYVIEDSTGKHILYVQLQKALFGMLKSALLFYRKLVSILTTMGFILNPYDPCMANKKVNGNQLTVSWHVDDLTISCINKAPIHHVIQQLKNIYGKNLKEHIDLFHDYLGMKFDYSMPGQVEISMDQYIANVNDLFPKQITGVSATPATDKLFLVHDNDCPLPEEQAIMSTTMLLLNYSLPPLVSASTSRQPSPSTLRA